MKEQFTLPLAESEILQNVAQMYNNDSVVINNNVTITGKMQFTSGYVFNLLPKGSVMAYNIASSIPPGWALCDGTNGTPDLRMKFIRGAYTDYGTTGGNETATLTVDTMPAHVHTTGNTFGGTSGTGGIGVHVNSMKTCASGFNCSPSSGNSEPPSNGTPYNGDVDYVGGGNSISIMPQLYNIQYIIKLS